jgi:hypothetical protein
MPPTRKRSKMEAVRRQTHLRASRSFLCQKRAAPVSPRPPDGALYRRKTARRGDEERDMYDAPRMIIFLLMATKFKMMTIISSVGRHTLKPLILSTSRCSALQYLRGQKFTSLLHRIMSNGKHHSKKYKKKIL